MHRTKYDSKDRTQNKMFWIQSLRSLPKQFTDCKAEEWLIALPGHLSKCLLELAQPHGLATTQAHGIRGHLAHFPSNTGNSYNILDRRPSAHPF